MYGAVMVATAIAGFFAVWFASRNATTLFVAQVIDGELIVQKGNIAPRAISHMRDVVARVPRATIRIVREQGRARLTASGKVGATELQQLRNVVGSMPLAQLVRFTERGPSPSPMPGKRRRKA